MDGDIINGRGFAGCFRWARDRVGAAADGLQLAAF